MDNKEFDDIIKKKLESLNTIGTDDAWDLFKEKWDNTSGTSEEKMSNEDLELDQKIRFDMQKLRIPFNSQHWIILKEQLELEALFKKKLFVAKSVELVILALLVLGILNIWPIQNEYYNIPVDSSPMVASIPVDKETAEIYEAREEARALQQRSNNKQALNSTKEIFRTLLPGVEKLGVFSSVLSAERNIEYIPTKENSTEKKVIKSQSQGIPFLQVEDNEAYFLQEEQRYSETGSSRGPIAYLQNSDLELFELPKRPTGFPDITLVKRDADKNETTSVSFAVGPKMNLINSPFDPVYRIDPYNIINTNFNISAKIHKEVGPIEMYVGLGYTNTSYEPRVVDELYEPMESQFNVASLENIKFKTFNVPVGVQYTLMGSKKYQLYATAGVDLNVIVDSDFIIQDVPVGSAPKPFGPPPSESTQSRPVNSNAKLSQKEFNNGILKGGSLKDNLYATASIGFGLNWKVASNTGLFIEPRYSHFISSKGIGPNEDKVHSVSVDLGFTYQLN